MTYVIHAGFGCSDPIKACGVWVGGCVSSFLLGGLPSSWADLQARVRVSHRYVLGCVSGLRVECPQRHVEAGGSLRRILPEEGASLHWLRGTSGEDSRLDMVNRPLVNKRLCFYFRFFWCGLFRVYRVRSGFLILSVCATTCWTRSARSVVAFHFSS